MLYVGLPDQTIRKLSFYLSMEEFIARGLPAGEYFFMWQVNPTVIFGRNQLMENEVNLEYIRTHGIEYYRRKSGGGCVYADFSNIMFSYITPDFNVNFTFDRYLQRVALNLRNLGVAASASGRNDILVDGKKVSGNAFYRVAGKSIVHGTMLFDTDLENLVRSITPSNEKLVSKGVESVRKRVTNLKEYLDMDIETFKCRMREMMCDGEITLTADQIASIEEIEKGYLSETWILGNNPQYTLVKKGYCDAGELEIRMEIKRNTIKSVNFLGDYFLTGEIDRLIDALTGVPFEPEAVKAALAPLPLGEFILNLNAEQLLHILFSES